jgi:hypothetical protein
LKWRHYHKLLLLRNWSQLLLLLLCMGMWYRL